MKNHITDGNYGLFPERAELLNPQVMEALKAAVHKLNRTQKLLALLYCYDKLSLRQLSEILEIDEEKCSFILTEAMKSICKTLPPEAVGRENMCRVFSEEIEAQITDPESFERLKQLLLSIVSKLE